MQIIYEDDVYTGRNKAFNGKTFKEILESLDAWGKARFITHFNSANTNKCLSDEICVNIKVGNGNFRRR